MKHQSIRQCNIERGLSKMEGWYAQPLGQQVFKAERAIVKTLLMNASGQHLVQLGGNNQQFYAPDDLPIDSRVKLSFDTCSTFPGPSIQADFFELPLAPGSVDVIVLPHVLDCVKHPKRLLSEAYQALVPGGYLLVLGFNPYSVWGGCKYVKVPALSPLQALYFHNPYKVRRWLYATHFDVQDQKTGFFRLPFNKESALLKTIFFETLGPLCWPGGGAFYAIMAKKCVYSPTRVGLSLWRKYVWGPNATTSPATPSVSHREPLK